MAVLLSLVQHVLENMFICGTPLLESVGLYEPPVIELRKTIITCIRKALIPLQAYAKNYEKYLELNNRDINSLLKYVAFKGKSRDLHKRFFYSCMGRLMRCLLH